MFFPTFSTAVEAERGSQGTKLMFPGEGRLSSISPPKAAVSTGLEPRTERKRKGQSQVVQESPGGT